LGEGKGTVSAGKKRKKPLCGDNRRGFSRMLAKKRHKPESSERARMWADKRKVEKS